MREYFHFAVAASVTLAVLLMGCSRPDISAGQRPSPTVSAAGFSPEGRWRSERGFTVTVRRLPDGTLELLDGRGGRRQFKRTGPDRWGGRISRLAQATIRREGNQLVFRREPTPEGRKPIAQAKGVTLARNIKTLEDRMTRVPANGGQ